MSMNFNPMSREKIITTVHSFWSEFKAFALKGNIFELALAVIIGTAFTAIVNSLVTDIVTPLLALGTGSVDFKNLTLTLRPDLVLRYGDVLQAIFNFLVISMSVFILFKFFSAARRRIRRE